MRSFRVSSGFEALPCVSLLFFSSGPVHVTADGGARAPRPGTGAARARAPGTGSGGTAADPAPAAEGIATATSRAPDTSRSRRAATLDT